MIETASEPRKLAIKLDVNESNIDALERASCEYILVAREQIYRDDYRRMPGLDELCSRHGDKDGRKVYMLNRDLEQKW
jgi:hypothetical protein